MNTFSKSIIVLILITILLHHSDAHAQRVVADVKITISERINVETRERFPDFKQIIETYINNSTWTNGDLNIVIPMNVEFVFTSASYGSEDRYAVQMLFSDNSDAQYFDQRCNFRFQQDEFLQHSTTNWTSFTALIDFYVYVILGDELDKFAKFMGTPYFEKAKLVAEQGNFLEPRFITGWDQRNTLIRELLSDGNKPFREMKDFYFYGYYFLTENPNKARQYIKESIKMMADILRANPDHDRCKKFLSAHFIEIVNLFKESQDTTIFTTLIEIDPDHKEAYEPYIN
ncbi:DUF4835 family protein [candidate division KSB1 bacterium]|nr:DUF4835 family protein [candidate division KSB1 bacterium]